MKLTPVQDKELMTRLVKKVHRSQIREMIEEFMASGEEMAEVDNDGYVKPCSCTFVITQAIKNGHIGGVWARTYKGKTYIYRTDAEREK